MPELLPILTRAIYLIDASGASGSGMPEVILQGIPVPPDIDLSSVYSSPFFFSTSVWIPGDIEDPITIGKFTNLNKLLVIQRKDFFIYYNINNWKKNGFSNCSFLGSGRSR